jgi:DNA mismatch endonuclease (patch repair protein)
MPATHIAFWRNKKAINVLRDHRVKRRLRKLGYGVLTVWECELRNPERVKQRIRNAIAVQRRKRVR